MNVLRSAIFLLLVPIGGCSLIVASTLDGKNADGDADADTDSDADCTLDGATPFTQASAILVNFAGGGENGPVAVRTSPDIARAGANLALIAKWTGSGGTFGYETQLFDESWANVTGHNRVQEVPDDPMSRGTIFTSPTTIFAIFPQMSSLMQIPLTYDAVLERIQEGPSLEVVTSAVPVRGPVAVPAEPHVFYLYSEAAPEGADADAFAAMAPVGEAASDVFTLNPGSGHHANVLGAYSAAHDRLVFVYERLSVGSGDVLYGVLDTTPSLVQAAQLLSPLGAQSGLPAVAASDEVALVLYTSRPNDTANFDLHWQVVNVSDSSLGADGVLSDAPSDAGAPSVVYHPDLDEFGVAWSELGVGQNEVWAARVAADGTPIWAPTMVSDQAGERPAVYIAPVSFGYAIVWDGGPTGLRTGWMGCVPQG